MSMLRRLGLAVLVVACCPWSASQAGVYVGVGFGGPYYRPYWGYYRPFGVYVAPPPMVVGAPPVIVQQPAVVQQPVVVQQPAVAQPAYSPPAQPPTPLPPPTPTNATDATPPQAPEVMPAVAATPTANGRQAEIDGYIRQLQSGDEQARADALVRLGRLRATQAIGPMVKALNSDVSPRVREAAARGLGLIGSPNALSALQYAAQSDDDREVRHSASFAAETIRGSLRRN